MSWKSDTVSWRPRRSSVAWRALLRLVQQAGRPIEAGMLIDLPLSRDDIAQMTGTTLYTVSRIVSSFEAAGLLEAGRQRVVIRSPQGLSRIADDLE